MSTRVAFLPSDIGIREAVFCARVPFALAAASIAAVEVDELWLRACDRLLGLGQEKLAGEGG